MTSPTTFETLIATYSSNLIPAINALPGAELPAPLVMDARTFTYLVETLSGRLDGCRSVYDSQADTADEAYRHLADALMADDADQHVHLRLAATELAELDGMAAEIALSA
ncbi:hypothetical protein P3T36_006357 [Kitasatospora sp. MAP12-15]|uniref:hypothetical protein n=1 Tax=unclassified Kitasatospora TaxID=2633591 RepID=UPI002473DCE6|nr:hypothetical protein [Kitasatospora sp. MAP12-44]MDH6107898.1 hypothetical protein [Kitasatospora sp. MAP12-44]